MKDIYPERFINKLEEEHESSFTVMLSLGIMGRCLLYLIQDVVSFFAGGDLDQSVQTLSGLLNQDIPASGIVPLATQSHHLRPYKRTMLFFFF